MAKKVIVVGTNFGITEMFRKQTGYKVILDGKPDIVVFTGGADINPKLYGEEPIRETHFDKRRDDEDLDAFEKYADAAKVGICRGGQFLNVMSGGSMFQHVNNHGKADGHKIINLLQIPGIEEKSIQVTSTHHQMMIAGELGEVVAIAKNHEYGDKGLATEYRSFQQRNKPRFDTEVVWYPTSRCLCYQPHPEYNTLPENREYFFKLMHHFFW